MSKDDPMSLRVAIDFAKNPRPCPSMQAPADTMDELREALTVLADEVERLREEIAELTRQNAVLWDAANDTNQQRQADQPSSALGQGAVGMDVLLQAIACCNAWEPNVRLIGNVRAVDLGDSLRELQSRRNADSADEVQK